MIQKLKLSDKFTIFKTTDTEFKVYKKQMLEIIHINKEMCIPTNNNSIWMETNAKCFRRVNSNIKDLITTITGKEFINFAEHYWIYTQTKGFDLEWMHQHIFVHPSNRSKILTDYTFTYYIQTPKDIKDEEGKIVFEDENQIRHSFLPREGDIFIFPSNIRHTAIPTPKSNIDRIVYAGSLCIDVFNQNNCNIKAI